MQPLKIFWNKPPSKPAVFEQERPQKPGHETVSTLHWPKNNILPFLKFLQKKVFPLYNKAPPHFNFGGCNLQILCGKTSTFIQNFFCRAWKLFCRNLKNGEMSILGQCNVETVSHLGFQGLSCSKVAGFEGGLFQKLFKGYIFLFSGSLTWWTAF